MRALVCAGKYLRKEEGIGSGVWGLGMMETPYVVSYGFEIGSSDCFVCRDLPVQFGFGHQ